MSLPTICLYVVGDTADEVRAQHGSFIDWFAPLFARHEVRVEAFDGCSGQLPETSRYDGVVTTGSRSSLTAPEPWMEASVEFIRQAYARRLPLLGVCFGHQLIGAAFGGSVVRNPSGWQLSTRSVEILPDAMDDPLFAGLSGHPGGLSANWAHQDMVDGDTLSPFNGIRTLARNDKASVAAIAAGPFMRGVQFHPEMSGAISRAIIEDRRDILAREAEALQRPHEHPDHLARSARDTPDGEQVFHNFLRHFVLDRRDQ